MSPPEPTPADRSPRFATRTNARLHGDIAHVIGRAILSGCHSPGEMLATEVDFSDRENVSRTAYREAIRMLAAKGLVESRPRTGTRVCERSRWNLLDPDILRWSFEEAAPKGYLLRGLFELRQIVEPAAAALAAERRTNLHRAALAEALADMRTNGLGTEEGRQADRRFHELILQATGNEVLASLGSGITAAVAFTTTFKFRMQPMPRDPIPDHEAVFLAIASGSSDAARAAMSALVDHALRDTLLAMDAEGIPLAD